MIIPWVRINWIDDFIGYGLFADRFIPKGTITFVQDGLDIVLSGDELHSLAPNLQEHVEKYSYEDYLGNRIISWDMGKYMNHNDEANTLTTGYGFEIAIRDIHPGEEITDDYRIFSTHHDTSFSPKKIDMDHLDEVRIWPQSLLDYWNQEVKKALVETMNVKQPLKEFLDGQLWTEITDKQFLTNYRGVELSLPLRYQSQLHHV
ncbi:MAG: SET domain-containing protein [Bdellovibrionales bacterium]|nr:SET domain-containing protein [Bdellovibrionales bacterium]